MADLTGWNVMRSRFHGRWIAESPDGIIYGFRTTTELHAAVAAYQQSHPAPTAQRRKDTPMARNLTLTYTHHGIWTIKEIQDFLDLADREGFPKTSRVETSGQTIRAIQHLPEDPTEAQK